MKWINYQLWVPNDIFEGRAEKMYPVMCLDWKLDKLEATVWDDLKPLPPIDVKWCELCEATGLDDKNGNPLYREDIVKAKYTYLKWNGSYEPIPQYNEDRLFIVSYERYQWRFRGISGGSSYEFTDYHDYSWGSGINDIWAGGESCDRLTEFEKIGNRYMNPELFNAK